MEEFEMHAGAKFDCSGERLHASSRSACRQCYTW
jgi:hypothetical protein